MENKNKNYYAVIMAGGVGSRFWPWSRQAQPKQFLDILGTGQSLLQLTYQRFLAFLRSENIYIITNAMYQSTILEQLPDMPPENIIAEPVAMNTAPCVAYASHKIHALNPQAVCVFAPSDHLILKEQVFTQTLQKAFEYSEQNPALVTIGITPNRPDTGYGYIQYIKNNETETKKVKTFTEKPDLQLAQTFIESGEFLWNSGIFIWSTKTILQNFEALQPEMYQIFKSGKKHYNTDAEAAFIDKVYPTCKSISIDYAIMEKSGQVVVLPSDLGWSDLGTWKSLFETRDKTTENNVLHGNKIMAYDCENSLILNQNPDSVVVVNGLDNMMIINAGNAILVCPLDREQEVKHLYNEVKNKHKDKFS